MQLSDLSARARRRKLTFLYLTGNIWHARHRRRLVKHARESSSANSSSRAEASFNPPKRYAASNSLLAPFSMFPSCTEAEYRRWPHPVGDPAGKKLNRASRPHRDPSSFALTEQTRHEVSPAAPRLTWLSLSIADPISRLISLAANVSICSRRSSVSRSRPSIFDLRSSQLPPSMSQEDPPDTGPHWPFCRPFHDADRTARLDWRSYSAPPALRLANRVDCNADRSHGRPECGQFARFS